MIFDIRFQIYRCTCVIAVVVAFANVAEADTLLRWKFTEGQQLQVVVDQQTTTKTTGAGKPTGINIEMRMQMTWAVDSVNEDGTARITQQLEAFRVSMKSGSAESITYDSTSDAKPSGAVAGIAAAIEPIIGAKFVVTMTDRGAVSSVELSDEAKAEVEAVESSALQELVSPEGISRLLQQATIEFPKDGLSDSGTWTSEVSTSSHLGELKQVRTYTLTKPEVVDGNSLERIELTGHLTVIPAESSKTKLKEQNMTGELLFDNKAGRLVSSKATQKITTEQPYSGFVIKVETTASTTTAISSN